MPLSNGGSGALGRRPDGTAATVILYGNDGSSPPYGARTRSIVISVRDSAPPPPPRARQARGQVRRRQHAATFFCRQSGANRRSPSRPTHLSARSRARESSGSPCTGTVSASSDPNVRGGADHSEWVVVSVEHERKAAAWSPRFSLWSPPDPKRETQPTPYAKDQR